jgi:peptidylprolyl isomerase/peptidyl-prolyl cis-trans isomerase B (cyclophilin B)
MRPLLPISILLVLGLMSCGGDSGGGQSAPAAASPQATAPAQQAGGGCHNDVCNSMRNRTSPPPTVIDSAHTYAATVHSSRGDFSLRLDPKAAPVTVNNFVYLAQNHFYDGLTFHRVVPGFVVQGGDPDGNGTGGPGYKLPDETNPAPWVKGSLGMASSAAGVNGSQFFVLLGDAPSLSSSGVYNHFGSVTSGADVVAAIQIGDSIRTIDVAAQ